MAVSEYPRTQHLVFSPQVADDDVVRPDDASSNDPLLREAVVITEKVDGGNCCLRYGQVFARTHGHQATHESFSWVKAFYSQFSYSELLQGKSLFGENMQAVHSIDYGGLPSFFFLFAVFDSENEAWLSWADMKGLATALHEETGADIALVPVLYEGKFESLADMEAWMSAEAEKPSAFRGQREGFVVRTSGAIARHDFDRKVAKYVRKGHVQTTPDWKRTWKQATLACVDS
ncbi:hypothetical protein DIPPA_13758 [Diplonema papillatum]|nr:hypothetical protein DIPPA_13758 [Diplonema papillatum]